MPRQFARPLLAAFMNDAGIAPSIVIERLTHRYAGADTPALNGVDLRIEGGGTFGLLGPNGAGKSTLLSILTGIAPPQSGSIQIGAQRLPNDLDAIKAISALVPQEYAFYPSLTGRENLKFFAGLYRLTPAQWRERLDRCVDVCRLQEVLDRRSEHYSGGLKRRLNLAIGLLAAPRILYLDEPTVGIDAVSRGYILDAIANLKGRGCTIVYTSHYMEEVEQLCDDLAVIDRGQVIARGRVAQLLSKQADRALLVTLSQSVSNDARSQLARWQAEFSDDRHVTLTAELSEIDAIASVIAAHGAHIEQLQYGVSRLHDVYLKLLEDRA
jgi:ABC-2 type transport system ATP-binding protein